jgi:3-methyladenine DNA glycosylase AlkD
MKRHAFVNKLVKSFEAHLDDELAIGMKKYMKDQFDFLGIKKPVRATLMKELMKEFKTLPENEWRTVILQLWELPFREYQYAAMEFCGKRVKELQPDDVAMLEQLLLKKSWWDTVDAIASNLVGELFRRFPEVVQSSIRKWLSTDNFWLHRTCIIFQLKYNDKTDRELLFSLCKRFAGEKEFFIRKAIGWALRQYSKSNPEAVRKFIHQQPLSGLSTREASKYL